MIRRWIGRWRSYNPIIEWFVRKAPIIRMAFFFGSMLVYIFLIWLSETVAGSEWISLVKLVIGIATVTGGVICWSVLFSFISNQAMRAKAGFALLIFLLVLIVARVAGIIHQYYN